MKLFIYLMWILHWLPLPFLGRLGEAIGLILFYVMKQRKNIALTNLRLCFPQKTEAQRIIIAKQHFKVYVRSILERGILWWGSKQRLKRLIKIEQNLPLDILKSGPTILLCPHFVCLEISGIALLLNSDISVCTMYTQQQNKIIDKALFKGRSRFHSALLVPRYKGIKPIIRAMRQGMPFIMLPDMDFGVRDGVFVSFFGIQAITLTALARIAAITSANIIPVVTTFMPAYKGWKTIFYPVWQNYPGNDIIAATQRMNIFIEKRVLENPAEYFWVHRRFKTRPSGFMDVYS